MYHFRSRKKTHRKESESSATGKAPKKRDKSDSGSESGSDHGKQVEKAKSSRGSDRKSRGDYLSAPLANQRVSHNERLSRRLQDQVDAMADIVSHLLCTFLSNG